MNERVPDSSGLPLRAMVMVLLFLGVVFLLLVWQALGSSPNSEDDSSAISTMTTTTAAPTSTSVKPAAPRAEVRVYNISGTEGAAARTADRLKAAGFTVTDDWESIVTRRRGDHGVLHRSRRRTGHRRRGRPDARSSGGAATARAVRPAARGHRRGDRLTLIRTPG